MDPASGLQSDFEHMQHASWVQGMSEAIKKGLLFIGFVGCRILVVSLIAYSKRYVIAFHVYSIPSSSPCRNALHPCGSEGCRPTGQGAAFSLPRRSRRQLRCKPTAA